MDDDDGDDEELSLAGLEDSLPDADDPISLPAKVISFASPIKDLSQDFAAADAPVYFSSSLDSNPNVSDQEVGKQAAALQSRSPNEKSKPKSQDKTCLKASRTLQLEAASKENHKSFHQSEEYMLSMMEELEADPEIGSDVEMVDADRDDGDDNDAGNDEDSPVEANAEDWLSKADEYEEDSSEDLDRSPLLPPPLPEDEMDQCCSQIEALLLQTSNQQHDEEEPEPVVMACWQQVKLVQIGAPDGVKKVADTLLSREKSSSLTVGRKSNSAKRTLAGAYVVPLDTALDAPGQPQLLSTSDITRIGRGTDTELTIGRNCQFVSRLHATVWTGLTLH